MRVRDYGAHRSTRGGIEAFKTDIPLAEENFFFFHSVDSQFAGFPAIFLFPLLYNLALHRLGRVFKRSEIHDIFIAELFEVFLRYFRPSAAASLENDVASPGSRAARNDQPGLLLPLHFLGLFDQVRHEFLHGLGKFVHSLLKIFGIDRELNGHGPCWV